MKFILSFIALLVVGGALLYVYYINSPYSTGVKRTFFGTQESMTIKSPSYENGTKIPSKYTCDGQNISPSLTFHAIPLETKSMVIIMEDPDASNFTHWLVYDIDPTTNGIEENSIPEGSVEGYNDFGDTHYAGPCPPSGEHKYIIKLYALNTMLGLAEGATKNEVIAKIQKHVIEEAELLGKYQKQ